MELKIKQLKETIVNSVNDSSLPLSLVSYVLKDLIQEIEVLRSQELQQQLQASQEVDKEEEEVEEVDAEIVEA